MDLELRIVFHHEKEYRFVNPFFRAWLIQWLNFFDLVGNFHIGQEESEEILKDVKRIEGSRF
jgi:hypothetical protein